MPGTLFLVPSTLGAAAAIDTIPAATLAVLLRLEHLIVESPKQARQFLGAAGLRLSERNLHFRTLDEHTADAALAGLLAPVLTGSDVGLLSDAGCPGIADPGAKLVRLAHAHGVVVAPLVGPSSITLALMASGLNGQRFAFHGYLPVAPHARSRALQALERQAKARDETQLMIETPYRNSKLLAAILATCNPQTLVCVAVNLTLPGQSIRTQTVAEWRRNPPDLDRQPAVFLLAAPSG
jgi:16S rRNA (cytidine1402-2'-O)-methyltransferase